MNRGPACKDCPARNGAYSPEECMGCDGSRSFDDKVIYTKKFDGESNPPIYNRVRRL